jgi:hypothetical protein
MLCSMLQFEAGAPAGQPLGCFCIGPRSVVFGHDSADANRYGVRRDNSKVRRPI